MSATLAVPRPDRTQGPVASGHGRLWATGAVLTSFVIALLPLLWDRRYFFRGDTQNAYSGWWYELGKQVLHGHIPLLSPQAWQTGNYIAEGQWGLFNPLIIAIGIALRLSPNIVAVIVAVKVGLVMIGALGMYLLLRSYRLAPAAAYAGAVLVGIGGQSVYYEWPSWWTGQMSTALLPWAWWLTRRAMRGRNPLPALLACYLVASIGYVYAAFYLAVVIVVCLVDAGAARDRAAFLRALGIGAFSALITYLVYLPGLRTAPVTVRAGWGIASDPRTSVTVSNLFTSMLPTTYNFYLLWSLPVILWVDPRRVRTASRDLRGALVGTVLMLVWLLGPSRIGPIRWPFRTMPAVMVVVVVLVGVLVARCVRAPGRGRVVLSLVWVAAATWVTMAGNWTASRDTVLGSLVAGVCLIALALAWRRGATVTGVVAGVCTAAVFLTQHAITPGVGALDRHSSAHPAAYRTQIPAARGDVMVVGDYDAASYQHRALAKQLLVGSTWYRNPATVQNGYSTIRFAAYNTKFCQHYNGITCSGALKALLADEPTTGRPWVDLLSISTLVLYRPAFGHASLGSLPTGWRVAASSRSTVTWVREHPVPTAGGVVATSAGVRLGAQHDRKQSDRFRVTSVPAGGGTVVLSRLAWPGYQVSGGSLSKPTAKMLVTVHLPASSAGHTVTVGWNPPGWRSEVAAFWLAVIGGLIWSLTLPIASLRRRRRRRAGSGSLPRDEHDVAVEPPAGRGREHQPDHVGGDVVG